MLTLDPRQIDRNRLMWRRISRLEALRLCRSHKVAVVQAGALGTGMGESAQWFGLNHPYYRGDGPFAAIREGLRFYLSLDGVKTLAKPTNGLAGEKAPGSFDPFDASNYTPLDEPEETKLYPITFELLSASGKPLPPTPYEITMPDGSKRTGTSGEDGFVRYEYNRTPGKAKLKLMPGEAVKTLTPDKPAGSDPEKFPITATLMNGRGEPISGLPYALVLANGKRLEGVSGSDGLISHPDNLVPGDVKLLFREVAAVEAPTAEVTGNKIPNTANGLATSSPTHSAQGSDPSEKTLRPIEIQLVNPKGKPLANRAYRMALPDGTQVQGQSDPDGFIRLPENTQAGEMDFALTSESAKPGETT
jgi:hypothetical protein